MLGSIRSHQSSAATARRQNFCHSATLASNPYPKIENLQKSVDVCAKLITDRDGHKEGENLLLKLSLKEIH